MNLQSYGVGNWAELRGTRRIWSYDRLPMPRAFFHGPRWRSHCGVTSRDIREVAPWAAPYHPNGRRLLVFTFEPDVRELVLEEELRPGVTPMWSDPYERFGVRRH